MYLEKRDGERNVAVILSPKEAPAYASAGFSIFSIFAHKIRKAAYEQMDADEPKEIEALHYSTSLPKIQRRLERQAELAQKRGSPISARELQMMADQVIHFTQHPETPPTPAAFIEPDIDGGEVELISGIHSFRDPHENRIRHRCFNHADWTR